jgi:hypothetical protein
LSIKIQQNADKIHQINIEEEAGGEDKRQKANVERQRLKVETGEREKRAER